MERLTDEQCDEFRRTRGSFNDMVRVIFEAGRMDAAQTCCELAMEYEGGRCGMYDKIEEHFDFKAS
jgi:hypothetical protein